MNVEEMNKEQYIEFRVNKGMDKEKVEKLFTQYEQDANDFEITVEADILEYIKKRFVQANSKKVRTNPETFYGVIVSHSLSDYGAQYTYDKAIEAREKDTDTALDAGLINEEGDPIWNTPTQKWKHKQLIVPADDLSNEIYGVALSEKEFTENSALAEEDKVPFKQLSLSIKGDAIELPQFALIKFEAVKGSKSNKTEYSLFGNLDIDFEVVKELSEGDINDFINKYFSENVVSIQDLGQFKTDHEGDYSHSNLAFVKAGLTDLVITDANKRSNVVVINDCYDEDVIPVSCWSPKHINVEYSTKATDVLVIGKIGGKEELSINVQGLWIDPKFKKKEDQESIAQSLVEE